MYALYNVFLIYSLCALEIYSLVLYYILYVIVHWQTHVLSLGTAELHYSQLMFLENSLDFPSTRLLFKLIQ